jgi:hypothetical protein
MHPQFNGSSSGQSGLVRYVAVMGTTGSGKTKFIVDTLGQSDHYSGDDGGLKSGEWQHIVCVQYSM